MRGLEAESHTSARSGTSVFLNDDKRKSTGEYDAPLETVTFEITEVNSPQATSAVCAGLQGLNGVRDVQFVGGGALVTFNPLGITKDEICTAIRRSGYRATEISTEADKG